jgi:hypothetical protein
MLHMPEVVRPTGISESKVERIVGMVGSPRSLTGGFAITPGGS